MSVNDPFASTSEALRDLALQQQQRPAQTPGQPRTARPKAPTSPDAWRAHTQAANVYARVKAGEITMAGAFRRLEADHDFRMRMLKRRAPNGGR